MAIKININSYVKVKLTERGKEIFKKQFDHLPASYKKRHNPSEFEPAVDANGYTKFQLCALMNLYGEYLAPGAPKVFKDMNIVTNGYEFCGLHENEEDDK